MSNFIFGKKIGSLIHGGDYNPEQWLDRPDILEKDIEYMKEAGINEATLGVFSWSIYEPREGEFHFEWLKEVMDNLYKNGIYTILATPSGARPAWLDRKYPEAMRVDGMGHRNRHGVRHNHCMSSTAYREKVRIIDTKLAEEVGNHPGLLMWHISNEFGGVCFCDICAEKFRDFLRDKYDNDIEKLNHEWWCSFWSARYESFDEVEPPYDNGQVANMGLKLDWRRFTSKNFADFASVEIEAVRKGSGRQDIPVTTNMMKRFEDINYHDFADVIDVISWDSYPDFHNDHETYMDTMLDSAFDHALVRGLKKDKPFMLMESAPGLVNWMSYNKIKRPGVHKQFSLQAVAAGSDTVQYFQFRKSRGAWEQFHGAVIDHVGTDDTRVFREVAETGEMLSNLKAVEGSVGKRDTAVLFDWENWWAIELTGGFNREDRKYVDTCAAYWKKFLELGVEPDVISARDSFEGYKLIIAPMVFLMREEVAEKIKDYVQAGGHILTTYMTGYVNENTLAHLGGFPGAGLTEVFGLRSEEIDTLYPSDRNAVIVKDGSGSEESWEVRDYAEVLRVKDAEIIGTYKEDYYGGQPALTCKNFGNGKAYYLAASCSMNDMEGFFRKLIAEAGVDRRDVPKGIEYHKRIGDGKLFEFYMNISDEELTVTDITGIDLITGRELKGAVTLAPKESVVTER